MKTMTYPSSTQIEQAGQELFPGMRKSLQQLNLEKLEEGVSRISQDVISKMKNDSYFKGKKTLTSDDLIHLAATHGNSILLDLENMQCYKNTNT